MDVILRIYVRGTFTKMPGIPTYKLAENAKPWPKIIVSETSYRKILENILNVRGYRDIDWAKDAEKRGF